MMKGNIMSNFISIKFKTDETNILNDKTETINSFIFIKEIELGTKHLFTEKTPGTDAYTSKFLKHLRMI